MREHKYKHYNSALGKHIEGKAHYEAEMKKGGYVTFEEGEKLAANWRKNHQSKPYEISKKALAIIKTAKNSADKKGRVKLSDRNIDALKSLGVDFRKRKLPQATVGGFYGS